MDLIIYETTHFENLSALLELSGRHFKKTTVFLTEQSYLQILPEFKMKDFLNNLHFEIQTEAITNRGFIKLFFKHIYANSYTHLHINTLEHNMFFFAMRLVKLRNIKLSITIHLINEYKTYSFTNLKKITESFAKFILRKKISNYRVLAPAMEPYFKACFPTKKVFFIPGNFYDPNVCIKKNDDNYFTIAIPGTVEAKRRDYPLVIKFFNSNILQLNHYAKIKVVLLGNANSDFGKNIVGQFQKLTSLDFLFEWFYEEVGQETYNKVFCETDIIWNPIIVRTKGIRDVEEISSTTISPGFITDQMHFGKPAIIPTGIQVHEVLNGCNYYYDTEDDLKKIFLDILSEPKTLQKKCRQTSEACNYFKSNNFEKAFLTMIGASLPDD